MTPDHRAWLDQLNRAIRELRIVINGNTKISASRRAGALMLLQTLKAFVEGGGEP